MDATSSLDQSLRMVPSGGKEEEEEAAGGEGATTPGGGGSREAGEDCTAAAAEEPCLGRGWQMGGGWVAETETEAGPKGREGGGGARERRRRQQRRPNIEIGARFKFAEKYISFSGSLPPLGANSPKARGKKQ